MGKFINEHRHFYEDNSGDTKEVNITVTENRATTDRSVELLNEFTQKAQDNIIKSIKLDNNNLKCVAIFYQDEFVSTRVHLHVRFMLNERCYFIKETFDKFRFNHQVKNQYEKLGNKEAIKFIYENLSKVIAQTLIQDQPEIFKELLGTLSMGILPTKYNY